MMDALARLLGLSRGKDAIPLRAQRWVVVDCESSGLDPVRDRLLSIGAVAVRAGRIDHADVYDALLRQTQASAVPNILIHGIGADAQLAGRDPAEVLDEFATFVAGGIPVAFHAAFDRALLERALPRWKRRWLDLAELAPALYPARATSCRALDDWLSAFAIEHPARHEAVADAYATAQLLLVCLAEAERQGNTSAGDLFAAARGRRWLG